MKSLIFGILLLGHAHSEPSYFRPDQSSPEAFSRAVTQDTERKIIQVQLTKVKRPEPYVPANTAMDSGDDVTLADHGLPNAKRIYRSSEYDIYRDPNKRAFEVYVVYHIPMDEPIFSYSDQGGIIRFNGPRFDRLMREPGDVLAAQLPSITLGGRNINGSTGYDVNFFVYVDGVHRTSQKGTSMVPSGTTAEAAILKLDAGNMSKLGERPVFEQTDRLYAQFLGDLMFLSGAEAAGTEGLKTAQASANQLQDPINRQKAAARDARVKAVWASLVNKHHYVTLESTGLNSKSLEEEPEYDWFKSILDGNNDPRFKPTALVARNHIGIIKAFSSECAASLASGSPSFSESTRTTLLQNGVEIGSKNSQVSTYHFDPKLANLVALYRNDDQFSTGSTASSLSFERLTRQVISLNGCNGPAMTQLLENLARSYSGRRSIQMERTGGYGSRPEKVFYAESGRQYFGRWLLAAETTSLKSFTSGGRTVTWQDIVKEFDQKWENTKVKSAGVSVAYTDDDGIAYRAFVSQDPISEGDFNKRLYIIKFDRNVIADWKNVAVRTYPDLDSASRTAAMREDLLEMKVPRLLKEGNAFVSYIWYGTELDPDKH